MPAPQTLVQGRPALGHVNLMVDTLIANVTIDDLRSIVRNLLASSPPDLATKFTSTARSRLALNAKAPSSSCTLFTIRGPTPQLRETLTRARSLYGAGMGFASLGVLTSVVRATVGIQWDENSEMADIVSVIDSDIGQAIQSSKEEVEGGRVTDFEAARATVAQLRSVVNDSLADVKTWGGEFPFERALVSIEYFEIPYPHTPLATYPLNLIYFMGL